MIVYYRHPYAYLQGRDRFGRWSDCAVVLVPGGSGPAGRFRFVTQQVQKMLAKKLVRGVTPGVADEVKACALSQRFGSLFDFIAADWWSETEARVPGKLHIWKDEGVLKACLADRDSARVLFLTARTLTELLEVADAALGDPGADWRADKRLLQERAARIKGTVDKPAKKR